MLRTLFLSFFQPHIEYCINIWTCAPKTTLEPIEISVKKAIRIISFAKRDSHFAPLFKVHNILNFQNLCKLNLGKLMWDLHYGNYPISLKNTLLFENKRRFDRQRSISLKYVPLSRKKYKFHFISSTGQICWRDIPGKIKKCCSKKTFSIQFRKYLCQ